MAEAPVQGRGPQAPAPLGIVYNTSMDRPDAALAVAVMNALADRREARVGAVCVTGAGFDAAVYCDIVGRFFVPGERNGNQALAVGLAAASPMPADSPMVRAVVERKKATGEPQYARGIQHVSDTSLAEAVLRNGVTFNAEGVMVLSAPATTLARSLDLLGVSDLYRKRVRRLVIVESGARQADVPALRRVVAEWPGPIVFCGHDVGDALPFPGARIDEVFKAAPGHPAADAYRSFKAMPYDAPMHDVAAMHYSVHPDSGFFELSAQGALTVSNDGALTFATGGGQVRRMSVDVAKKAAALDALLAIVGAAPTPPPARGGLRGRGAA